MKIHWPLSPEHSEDASAFPSSVFLLHWTQFSLEEKDQVLQISQGSVTGSLPNEERREKQKGDFLTTLGVLTSDISPYWLVYFCCFYVIAYFVSFTWFQESFLVLNTYSYNVTVGRVGHKLFNLREKVPERGLDEAERGVSLVCFHPMHQVTTYFWGQYWGQPRPWGEGKEIIS